VKRALVLAQGPFITPEDLELEPPADTEAPGATLKAAREEMEKEVISRALAENRGNISKTAKELGISRPTLYELIAKYGLGK
jgi:two-component system NtrC family response regulator